MPVERSPQGPAPRGLGLEAPLALSHDLPERVRLARQALGARAERLTVTAFVLPAVLALLFLSIFPLVVSLYISLTRFTIAPGGFQMTFVGLANYAKLLVGREQSHFLGVFAPSTPLHWLAFGLVATGLTIFWVRSVRTSSRSFAAVLGRSLVVIGLAALAWMLIETLSPGGRLGTLGITLVFVFVGISFQFVLGLGLALLVVQHLPGRRFYRVVFLLPMMITPVGVAYMFRMVSDTDKGPLTPLWHTAGLSHFAWINDPWAARAAIMIADIWQWTPFMFIVLVAGLESQGMEPLEAALVDGASDWQLFRHITWPEILPVSLTVLLIRMIEAFKIVDLPSVMTGGAPGTATESLTLQAFILWRNLDLGSSASVAYMLLFAVTFFSIVFVQLIRQRALQHL